MTNTSGPSGSLQACRVSRSYPARPGRAAVAAVDRVDLTVAAGERVALVGRSGSGKSTLLRMLMAVESPEHGRITFDGTPVLPGRPRRTRWFRQRVQYIPQDPAHSLDPRLTVRRCLRQPLHHLDFPGDHDERIHDVLTAVGLDPTLADRRPAELSGGQRQRVTIARALAPGAEMLVADEPVSGLDLPLRAQVLDLLSGVSRDLGVALLVVTHDLSTAARLCERTVVMHDGRIVENRDTSALLADPRDPAGRELVAALPRLPR